MHMEIPLVALFGILAFSHIANAATTPAPKGTTPAGTTPRAKTHAATTPAATSPAATTAPADLGILPGGGEPECTEKKACPGKNSTCIDGRCLCKEGFSPVGNDTCIAAPHLGEKCVFGSTELFCAGVGVDSQCPNGTAICQCRAGYEPDTKNAGTCKPAIRDVGSSCKVDGDCTAAFTACFEGKCACNKGFKADDKTKLCAPTEFRCLNNEKPLQEKGSVKFCELSVNLETGEPGNDTCPSGHFCYQWQNSRSSKRGAVGHCCPKPKEGANITAVCPIGLEHSKGKCIDFSQYPADKELPDLGPICPFDTYECLHNTVCCPLACRSSSSHFNIAGRCYDTAILDQSCEHDAQCFDGAVCTKGTCQCQKGYTRAKDSLTLCLAPGQKDPFHEAP